MVAKDAALLQAPLEALPEVSCGRPEEVPNTLRRVRQLGAIASMGVIVTPPGANASLLQ